MSAVQPPVSPYKGLSAFDDSELDALLFFGRERETEIVAANLIASRLTVLYGPSGVGKSSLLRAAVARSLRRLPEEPLVVVFSQWSGDPAVGLSQSVAAEGGVQGGTMLSVIEAAQADRDVYVILDGAEEYFLYHADDAGTTSFAELLPSVLAKPLRVNVLISLREDSLAKLDRFTGRISGLFANTLRLDRLDRAAGRSAIAKPLGRYAELTGEAVGIEPELVERVLDEVVSGRIEPALGGLGAVDDATGSRIEAPYLQLVMQRLWDEERASDSNVLRVATLERLGGAQHIVEEHLESAMAELDEAEKDVAARLFNHLVTPSGTKIAHEVADLADFGHVTAGEVEPVLDTLAERRILRSVDEGGARRFEIFHDVLAEPVLAWRSRHRTERAIEQQLAESHRRRRRLQWLVAGVLVALAVMTAVSVFAIDQREEAQEQTDHARANGLVAAADSALGRDPQLGLLLAREAAALRSDDRVARALRRALVTSRVRQIVDVSEPVVAAWPTGSSVIAATTSGNIFEVARNGMVSRRIDVGEPLTHLSLANDETMLVTTRSGDVYVVERSGLRRVARSARRAELSPDGSRAAVVRDDGVELVSVQTGARLQRYPHAGARSAAISADNRRVLTGGIDDAVRVWSGQSGRRVHELTEHDGAAVAVAYSPDGEFVATASSDGTGRVWRTSDWNLVSSLTGHTNGLTNVAFSADGEHVATTGKDSTAQVYDVATGDWLYTLAGHRGFVESAVFTGSIGSDIVTAGVDGTIRRWDGVHQPELDVLARLPSPVTSLTADESGVHVRTEEGNEYTLALPTGERLSSRAVPKRRPRRVVGPDGTSATIRQNSVRILRDGEVSRLTGHRDDVTSAAFSPHGDRLVTGSKDQTARIWDLESHDVVRELQHNTEVRDAQFSPDGRWLVTSTLRATIWDASDGSVVLRLRGHDGPVASAAFDPSGRWVITGGADGTVRIYRCRVCGDVDELTALADAHLAATGRELSQEERRLYLD